MNCRILLTQLDDYLDDELRPEQHAQVQTHLSTCDGCHRAWKQELQFRQLMKEHPVPLPAAGLEERAFNKIPNRSAEKSSVKSIASKRSAFVAGFSGAIAAGIVLMVTAVFVFGPAKEQQIPNITLTLNQSKKVNMVFNVPEKVAEATFSMQLPKHVEIAGYKGLHKIEWKTALKKGKNLLSLPVIATAADSGELIAQIKYGDQVKTFRLKLDIHSTEQGMTHMIKVGAV